MLPFIGQKFGGTSLQISILFTLMPAIVIIVAPLWGRLSDKFGRKPVLMASLAASSVTFILFGMADNLSGMFVTRALQGITGGNVSIAFAIVADSTTHEDRAKYLGYTSGSMALAFMIGPLLGGLFMGNDLETFTHARPSFIAAGISAMATMVGVLFLKESRPVRRLSPKADKVKAALSQPYEPPGAPVGRFGLTLIILQFLIGGYVGGSDQFAFAFWAQGLHSWGPNDVSFGMAAMGGAYILATVILIGPLTKQLGDLGAYVIGSFINITGLTLLLLAPSIWPAFAGLMIAVVGIGIWNTVLSSVLTKISPEDKIGYMLGVSNGASMIGRVLGPLVAGAVFLDISIELPFAVSLGLVAIVLGNAIRILISQRLRSRA